MGVEEGLGRFELLGVVWVVTGPVTVVGLEVEGNTEAGTTGPVRVGERVAEKGAAFSSSQACKNNNPKGVQRFVF